MFLENQACRASGAYLMDSPHDIRPAKSGSTVPKPPRIGLSFAASRPVTKKLKPIALTADIRLKAVRDSAIGNDDGVFRRIRLDVSP